jgi:hypothetical protein
MVFGAKEAVDAAHTINVKIHKTKPPKKDHKHEKQIVDSTIFINNRIVAKKSAALGVVNLVSSILLTVQKGEIDRDLCLAKIEKATNQLNNEEGELHEAYGFNVRADDTDYTVIDSLFV